MKGEDAEEENNHVTETLLWEVMQFASVFPMSAVTGS